MTTHTDRKCASSVLDLSPPLFKSRSGDRRRDSRPDEEILNSGSSEELLGNASNDCRERDTHPLPMVSRRRTSHSPDRRLSHSGGTTSRNSGSSVSRSPRDRSPSGEGGHKVKNRRRDRDKGRRLGRSSSNSRSSRDDGPDSEANRKGRRERGYDREGGQRTSWGRNSTPERRRDTRHSYGSDRRRWRHDTASDLDSEDEKERVFRSEKHTQHRHKGNRGTRDNIKNGKGRGEGGHWLSHSSTDERRDSGIDSDGSSQSRERRHERRPRNRSKSEGRVNGKSGHGRRIDIGKEDEEVGRVRNKYDAEARDTATVDIVSERGTSPVLARIDDDQALHQDTDSDNGASYAGDGTLDTQRNRGKEVCGSDIRENSREKPVSGRGVSPTGSGHSVTDRAAPSQSPSIHGASAGSPSGKPSGASTRVTFGKPIRGARWGEAIGVRSRVFDTTTIPTAKGDLKSFVTSPLRAGPGTVLRCFIERKRSGTHNFSNMFSLYADLEDGSGRLLLAARKVRIIR